jgi:hypothetical protein
VPPRDDDVGAASFCLADFEPGAWRSKARGGWLLARTDPALGVGVGDVVIVCEGRRVVAYFQVTDTESSA